MSTKGIVNAGGGRAWGDIFQVNTPYIDQLGKQIYQQDQLRQLQQQKESEALDNQFSKSVANIRDADVNEYADKYNAWKQAKIGLMKMGNNSNSKDYIAAQMDANRKLADMSQFGNNSIANKAALKAITGEYGKDKAGLFKTDTGTMISKADALPSSQWGTLTMKDEDSGKDVPFDPTNLDQYKYTGNTTKLQPIIQKATGDIKTRGMTDPTQITDKAGKVLGTQQSEIKAVNSPLDYYTQLAGGLSGSRAVGNLNARYPFSDDEAQNILEQYNDKVLNNPIDKQAWGEGIKLPTNALLTPATRTIALLAMQHALTHQPEVGTPKQIYNKALMMDKQQGFQQAQQGRSFAQQDHLLVARNNYSKTLFDYKQAKTTGQEQGILNQYIDNASAAGSTRFNETDIPSVTIDGKEYAGKFIDVPISVKKDYITYDAKGDAHLPDAIYLTNDKKTVIPITFGNKTSSGNYHIKGSKPQDVQTLKVSLSKALLTKKQTGAEVTDDDFSDDGSDDGSDETSSGQVKIQVGSKIFKVPKNSLPKMDKDKVQYKVIK